MQCLVAAVRPLRVRELAEILAFDFDTEGIPKLNPGWRWEDQEEAVMSACSSLVIIVKDGDTRVVQFSHFSVKEYLTASRLAEPIRDVSHYHIRLEATHTILAQACLGVLLRLDGSVDRDNINNFPLARYAARYWTTHAQFENASSWIKDGMECLFDADRPHFASWLWIYNKDRGLSMSTMRPEEPGTRPLYYAARHGFRDLAEHLIAEHPEHVNARGGAEETPMHAAASAGHADILSLLLEHGADLDGRGTSSHTPLHRAARRGKVEAGRCLINHGADIDARSNVKWTPLHCAANFSRAEFVQLLLECGATTDARTLSDKTPLHFAAQAKSVETVRLLLEHGADVNARDNAGQTPSQFATQREIAELLSHYGAKSVRALINFD
jgi:ankyrin repeat protein